MSINRARQLRRDATPAERAMWRLLYSIRKHHNFRRQVPLGAYYVDFACHALRLVVEIDGETHGTQVAQQYDQGRTRFIEAEGYKVIRFTNGDVLNNPEGVYEVLSAYTNIRPALPPPLSPPHKGEGDDRTALSSLVILKNDWEGLPPPCGEGTGVGVLARSNADEDLH